MEISASQSVEKYVHTLRSILKGISLSTLGTNIRGRLFIQAESSLRGVDPSAWKPLMPLSCLSQGSKLFLQP